MARWQQVERNARFRKARDAGRPVVVSEGDSWFDYPMYENIIDHVDDTNRFAIRRLEFSGDTVLHMVGDGSAGSGVDQLRTVVLAERPRMLLFSGGGNDIAGDEITDGVRHYDATQGPAWHLDTPVWRRITAEIAQGYRTLIRTIGPHAPVFAHGYDYLIPADRPARYDGWAIAGPWIWPELARKEIPDAFMPAIGAAMIDWFNGLLQDLDQEYASRGWFAHLDLRNTLKRSQWENEIHPTEKGFEAVAARFLERLDARLPAVITAHDAEHLGIA